ncbi:hypothetical protein G6F35_014847 [Rhizopus arrhizus]|nr:hypothetical protein G6F35_014847 [Rhizopus arrhizus]
MNSSLTWAGFALADPDDAVTRLQRAVDRCRATGDDLADHHHVVLALQLRADAFQRQRHRLVEVLGGARGEVISVRINRAGVRVHEELEDVFALQLIDRLLQRGIALVQRLADIVRLLAGQLQAQPVVLDRLAPQLIQLGAAGRPRHLLAVVFETLVGGETANTWNAGSSSPPRMAEEILASNGAKRATSAWVKYCLPPSSVSR